MHTRRRNLLAEIVGGSESMALEGDPRETSGGFRMSPLPTGGVVHQEILRKTDQTRWGKKSKARICRDSTRGGGAVLVSLVRWRYMKPPWEGVKKNQGGGVSQNRRGHRPVPCRIKTGVRRRPCRARGRGDSYAS